MLVLSRRLNERIIIEDKNGVVGSIVVAGIKSDGSVKLGFEAPVTVKFIREEIFRKNQDNIILDPSKRGEKEG